MKRIILHLVSALSLLLLGQIFLFGCDERTSKEGLSTMDFQGDAIIEFLEKPAFFASKGVQLNFEKFRLTDGIDKTYALKNIPSLKQPYRLMFLPDDIISNDLSTNILITTMLEDSKGIKHWSVEAPLSQWRVSEAEGRGPVYFYMLSTKTGVVECAFSPCPNTEYKLHVKCMVLNPALTVNAINMNARLRLRAGGYK